MRAPSRPLDQSPQYVRSSPHGASGTSPAAVDAHHGHRLLRLFSMPVPDAIVLPTLIYRCGENYAHHHAAVRCRRRHSHLSILIRPLHVRHARRQQGTLLQQRLKASLVLAAVVLHRPQQLRQHALPQE